jgi:hypothetical protein
MKRTGFRHRAMLQKLSRDGSKLGLIDIRSRTFSVVSGLLSPLESPEHIIVTHTISSLEVFLPRLRLSFFVNKSGELECGSLPGYIIDTNQSCGTLFGLENKLVLSPCPSDYEEPLPQRRVIIPQGDISFCIDGDFAKVSINTNPVQHVLWHEYTVDTNLRCLISNLSLSSKLYQCYLHALTSHCLPDPLLGHSGTEEALYILRSAACQSFQRLNDHERNQLKLISNLSPRIFSSINKLWRGTVTVEWNDLPALTQRHDFFRSVCAILHHGRTLEALYGPLDILKTPNRNHILLARAASRNQSYYPSALYIPDQSLSPNDFEYRSRDRSDRSRRPEEYFASISRNIRLKEHTLQLQDIIQHYHTVSIPATMPYVFPPRFTTGHSKAHPYSLHHILASRVNVPIESIPSAHKEPIQLRFIPPIPTNKNAIPRADSDSLGTLIEEIRHSSTALLQLFGNDLNDSRRELLGQNISHAARVAIPSHGALLFYYKECSDRKDKLFSEISTALAPSQNVEEISCIAGLWPTITPRSILRQLAQDRVKTLPDYWKFVIMRYAISFLRYQQSLRLLQLSSRRKHEDLLQEIETIRHDVLAESTPDWLLIQVCRMPC